MPTEDPKEMIGGLWESLRRAADEHWGQDAEVLQQKEGFLVRLYLGSMNVEDWSDASKFIRGYIRDSGWKIGPLMKSQHYIEFTIRSKLSSSLSKKA